VNPSTIVLRAAFVLIALAITSVTWSIGAELTNAPDDISVGAGFMLQGVLALAWLYAGLRVWNHFAGSTKGD
jgi:hypothetical protein